MRSLFMVTLFLTINAAALVCPQITPKLEDPADYLISMADGLGTVKMPFIKMKKVMAGANSDLVAAMVALKELKAGYDCASKMMGSYKSSKNQSISESADTLEMAYRMLGAGVDESITDLKSAIDGKRPRSAGERAESSANKMLEVKEKWELVMMAIGLGTTAALDKENPKTKKMDSLVITKAEKNKIVEILKSNFSKLGNKGDNDPIDAAANVYYSFFQQGWKLKSK